METFIVDRLRNMTWLISVWGQFESQLSQMESWDYVWMQWFCVQWSLRPARLWGPEPAPPPAPPCLSTSGSSGSVSHHSTAGRTQLHRLVIPCQGTVMQAICFAWSTIEGNKFCFVSHLINNRRVSSAWIKIDFGHFIVKNLYRGGLSLFSPNYWSWWN